LTLWLYLDASGTTRGVDTDDAQAPGDVHHAEPEHDVGSGSLAHANNALDLEHVQNVDQILSNFLQIKQKRKYEKVLNKFKVP